MLITVDPYIPVPPRLYGGIERVIDMLVRGLHERGHEVTLIAHPESAAHATLIPYGVPPHQGLAPRLDRGLAHEFVERARSHARGKRCGAVGAFNGFFFFE